MDPTRFSGTKQEVEGLLHQKLEMLRSSPNEHTIFANPTRVREGRFVRGPIPYGWLSAALLCGHKAGNLAWAIWWLKGMKPAKPIRLTKQVLQDFRVSTRTARRLLEDFEQAQLIHVDRHRGRAPLVTVLKVDGGKSQDSSPECTEGSSED